MRVQAAEFTILKRGDGHGGVVCHAHVADIPGLLFGEEVFVREAESLAETSEQIVLEFRTLVPPVFHKGTEAWENIFGEPAVGGYVVADIVGVSHFDGFLGFWCGFTQGLDFFAVEDQLADEGEANFCEAAVVVDFTAWRVGNGLLDVMGKGEEAFGLVTISNRE